MPAHCYTIEKILTLSFKYGLRINKHSTFMNELVMLDFEIYKYNTQKKLFESAHRLCMHNVSYSTRLKGRIIIVDAFKE